MNRSDKKAHPLSPPYAVKKSPVHGNGVFAIRKIPAETRIVEYKGERITWKQAAKRETGQEDNPYHTFYFSLEDGGVIDAGVRGSDARWINHACEPNCEAREENGRVFIYALRDIRRGEELSYNYSLIIDERHTLALKRAYACRCGAGACRGTMLEQKRRRSPKPIDR
ncbi:MAG: SET domain-containing protein-lysine N-methyltransferase [Burkholderiales bacterium]|nr:SET domain-containing protein-lysine N-methyltransferase [Burkholderiales bacterium]